VEVLIAEAGRDDEYMGGRKDVCTLLGFARLAAGMEVGCELVRVGIGTMEVSEGDCEDMVRRRWFAPGSIERMKQ